MRSAPRPSSLIERALSSGGRSLDSEARSLFEPRFGHDFAAVQVHTGEEAARSAHALGARAYTFGSHIVFGSGQYDPHASAGRAVLAHELAHVVQQAPLVSSLGGRPQVSSHEQISLPGQAHENEAEVAVRRVTRGGLAGPLSPLASPTIQRLADLTKVPKGLRCDVATGTPSHTGTDLLFATGSSSIAGMDVSIDGFVSTWIGAGASEDVLVDGYASTPGPQELNWRLSCARAEAVRDALVARGVPGNKIHLTAHGETTEFSAGDPLMNQRAIISRTAPAAAPPVPGPGVAAGAPVAGISVVIPTHIRGAAEPASMGPDRIPPRLVTTVPVVVAGPVSSANPVLVAIEGGSATNGTVSVNAATSVTLSVPGAHTIVLRGLTQTAPGSAAGLKLIARTGIGGAVLASSDGFSVSSIPQNLSFTLDHLITTGSTRGFVIDYAWDSDSGVKADLDKAEMNERVEVASATGSFVGSTKHVSPTYLRADDGMIDTHDSDATDDGTEEVHQTFEFKDNRVGATDVPMTRTGFEIIRVVRPVPGTGFAGFFRDHTITTTKRGLATTALGIASAAGTGLQTDTEPTP